MLSGTETNLRINFIRGLRGFNLRLALIGFPGTGARTKATMLEVVATNKPSGTSVLLLKEIKNQTLQIGWDENNKIWQKNVKLSMLNSHIQYTSSSINPKIA